jgi:hypothetical protein
MMPPFRILTSMLHNARHQLAVLDHGHQLLRNRSFHKLALLATGLGQRDVDRARLGRHELDSETLLREVDLPAVRRIHQDRGDDAEDLDCEGRRRRDFEGRDSGFE